MFICLNMKKPVDYIRIIKGRPIDLSERAPSFQNEGLRGAAGEYYVGQIIPTLQYLISDEPISERFWRGANYSYLEFVYNNETKTLSTNHGSEACMCAVIDRKLDISDWVLDLFNLTGPVFHKPGEEPQEEEYEAFKKEVQDKTKDGIKKYLVE